MHFTFFKRACFYLNASSPWWIRTTECMNQNHMPYLLANGLHNYTKYQLNPKYFLFSSIDFVIKEATDLLPCLLFVNPLSISH